MPSIEGLLRKEGVIRTRAHQCAYNLLSKDDEGVGLVYKPTAFLTNAPFVAERLQRRCSNIESKNVHRHVHLLSGRARKAQVYPPELCRAICAGIRDQKNYDGSGERLIGSFEVDRISKEDLKDMEKKSNGLHEDHDQDMIAIDDVTGARLDIRLVREAREAEMKYFKKMGVYRKVPIQKCFEMTGKAPIGVRWIDVNKQDNEHPRYRSRLVAKEFKTQNDPTLFAATPPLEVLKIIISLAATRNDRGNIHRKIMINDVSRAYFYAVSETPTYVKLCSEDQDEGDQGMCGELRVSMYGTRKAAQNWQKCVHGSLSKLGFRCGQASPCIYWHPKRDIVTMVHGDDFISAGGGDDLSWMSKSLEKQFEISTETIGPEHSDQKQAK
eukprot:12417904-Karenia_brevis.AAC.1